MAFHKQQRAADASQRQPDLILRDPFHNPVADIVAGDPDAASEAYAVAIELHESGGLAQRPAVNGLQVIDVHAVRNKCAPRQGECLRRETACCEWTERANLGHRQIESRSLAGKDEYAVKSLDHGEAKLRRAGNNASISGNEPSIIAYGAVMKRTPQAVADDLAMPQVTSGMGTMRREGHGSAAGVAAVQNDLDVSERAGENGARFQLCGSCDQIPVLRTSGSRGSRHCICGHQPKRMRHHVHALRLRDHLPIKNPTRTKTNPTPSVIHLTLDFRASRIGLSNMFAE